MSNRDHKRTLARICGSIAALTAISSTNTIAAVSIGQARNNAFDQVRVVGPPDQPMLIVPVGVPDWAANLGVTGAERVYKGICGPSGAAISVEDLFRVAQQDLQGHGGNPRGTMTTVVVGESPSFAITYNITDPQFGLFYLPSVIDAAEYIGNSFDNRVQIDATMALGTFGGNTIGTAGSTHYIIPWSVYVEGLRHQSLRDDARFAGALPAPSVPVLYDGSTTPTTETRMVVTDAQLRAVFGDNVFPHSESVSITLNRNAAWHVFGCATEPESDQLSLVDVAVHEFTHSMGFNSGSDEGGNNSNNLIQGLDVARFRATNIPVSNATFASNPRIGEAFTSELHYYSSFPTGASTLLESGDNYQPSHLNYVPNSVDKLGIMDPVISGGTTRCPGFYSENDLQPLDDMGWRPVNANNFHDCNGNGDYDYVDIDITHVSADVDNDRIPDECETFYFGAGDPGTPSGVTRTIYSTPGLTDLSFFDPNGPSVMPLTQVVVSDMDDSATLPGGETRVFQYEFSMFVPARDEYAFRVEHPDDMFLLIDNIVIGDSERAGSISGADGSASFSSQSFMQLEAGWHNVIVQALSNNATTHVRLIREARSLAGWQDIPSNNLKTINFTDCDGNGQGDTADVYGDLGNRIDLGSVGEANTPIQFDTFGSGFDTEMALWDASGTLIDMNDDAPSGGRQSIIMQSLSAGQYTLAINGYNSVYANGPDLDFVGGCSDSGSYRLNIDSFEVISGSIPSGRVHTFTFTIGAGADCDGDGIPDNQELDCDGDGTPDECQIPSVVDANDAGPVGDSSQPITISTCGSDFDTEIALWDEIGTLIDQNDDSDCGLASEITASLAPGYYFVAFAGYNAVFENDFGITINANGECSAGGMLSASIGDQSDTTMLSPGRVILIGFEVTDSSVCNGADLNMDGMLNFFDVSLFLTAFNAHDPIADFNDDGQFNFFDVSGFLGLFTQGCP